MEMRHTMCQPGHAMPKGIAWLLTLVLLLGSCGRDTGRDTARELHGRAVESLDSCDYPTALRLALAQIDKADADRDMAMRAEGHATIADAYRAVYNLPAARRHRMAAALDFEACDSTMSAFYAYMDLAGEYSHEDNDSARMMMENARVLIGKDDTTARRQYEFIYADICRVRGDFAEALRHLRAAGSGWLAAIALPEDSVHMGEIYFRNDMPDSAAAYFATEASADNIQYWECMAEQREAEGDLAAALEARKKMQALEFDKSATALTNSLEFVERTHYARKAEAEKARRERLTAWLLRAAAALAAGALAWLLWHYIRRARRYKTESDMKDVVMIDAKADAEPDATPADPGQTDRTADNDNDKWIYVILDFYMSRLNGISREYFRTPDEQGRRLIEAEFNRELRSLREGDIFEEIEKRVNDRLDGVMRHIRHDFPRFNEQYLRLMLCSLAGLSSQSTCLLLSVEKGNYYVMWTRIRAKIRLCESERRGLYESLFLSR